MRSTFMAVALALVSRAAVVPLSSECSYQPGPSTCSAAHRREHYDSAGGNGDKVLWDILKALHHTKRDPLLRGNPDAEMWKAFHSYWATRTSRPFASATSTTADTSLSARSFINWTSVCSQARGRERFGSMCEDYEPQTVKPSGLAGRN
ncbi:hypothetical protein CPB85DRAFT_1436978 [Mucidula mucida]|nr:hypothetical protein CPB85DRAFT_1436978 [Mucidula mucida]